MLSILIPIYNFNAVPLVKELQKQCMECDLEFEICIDDCSTLHQQENQAISSIEKCSFRVLHENIGRSKIRNLLAAEASYKWLLFLDCDIYPEKSLFISNYANQIKQSQSEAIYGGLHIKIFNRK
jgi:glycosyltransferase involved in cell wall biosynthesis